MATTIKMPQLGESVTEGTIERWLVKEGDTVEQYDPLFEVVTDKVNAEVPAEIAGKVTKIMVGDGQTVKVGTPLAEIDAGDGAAEAGDQPLAEAKSSDTATQDEPPGAREAAPAEVSAQAEAAAGIQASAETGPEADAAGRAAETAALKLEPTSGGAVNGGGGQSAGGEDRSDGAARMTPVVRRLVREHGIDIAQLKGSGAGGRITRDDVLEFGRRRDEGGAPQEAPAAGEEPEPARREQPTAAGYAPPTSVAAPSGGDSAIAMTQMRKGIAAHMVKAKQTIPHAYTVVEVDMTNVVRWREAMSNEYKAREGVGLSYVAVLVKAVTETLRTHPTLNAQYAEDKIILKQRMNIGIAVAVDDGLLVPVIHDADQLSIAGVNRKINDLAARARANRLRLDEIQGGTLTVNNTGWFGSVTSMPIVNAPEVAILSMEAIVKRPRVIEMDRTDVIAIRHMMNLCASFDHRVLDGAQVGAFMQDVRSRLEGWPITTPIS
ncbi:MAG: dihydrolipoamide acetyltransferase family protein [Candidatus Limnocylindria bacterium]